MDNSHCLRRLPFAEFGSSARLRSYARRTPPVGPPRLYGLGDGFGSEDLGVRDPAGIEQRLALLNGDVVALAGSAVRGFVVVPSGFLSVGSLVAAYLSSSGVRNACGSIKANGEGKE
jgi:hypothetical protein